MKPDWVMFGASVDGKVRLIASQTLSQAQLQAFYRLIDTSGLVHKYVLTADMSSLIIVEADDYTAAFNSLFKKWSPQSSHPSLTGTPELEA